MTATNRAINEIAMIFQEPMTSLNPVYTIGDQIAEAFAEHRGESRREAWTSAVEMLERVGIPDPERRAGRLSAPVLRRHAPARHDRDGAGCRPTLLIADEPTTALDVTIQAQILDLLRGSAARSAWRCSSSPTTWAWSPRSPTASPSCTPGEWSRRAPCATIFRNPRHPYTRGLLGSIAAPRRGPDGSASALRHCRHRAGPRSTCHRAAPSRPAARWRSTACRRDAAAGGGDAGQAARCTRWRELRASTCPMRRQRARRADAAFRRAARCRGPHQAFRRRSALFGAAAGHAPSTT